MEEMESLTDINKISLVSETTKKVEKILRQLLEPDFKIKNDLYLNLLLTQWANKTETGEITNPDLELDELFSQWIIAASNLWTEQNIVPSTPVLIFALHVCCQLNTNERIFVRMNSENVFQKLAEVSQANKDLDSGVTVGFITLLSSVVDYAIGVEWLLTTTYWNEIINIALKGRTKYIKKKAYQFIIKLLEITVLLDQEFCEELVEILVEPLIEAAEKAESTKDLQDENKKLYESLKPWLDLVLEIADTLLKKFNKNVLNIFFETEIPEAIQNILNFSQIEDFSLDLLKIRFVLLFYQLCVKLEGIQQPTHDEDTLFDIRIMFELIQAEIEKEHDTGVIKICHYALVLYCNLDTHIPLCIRKGESIEFQNQMLLFLLVPVMTLSHQLIGLQKAKQLLRTDDVRHDFYLKFAKISAIKTFELSSRWEVHLSTKPNLIEDISLSLQYIRKSKKIIKKEQAAFIFRPLTYIINDIACRLESFQKKNMQKSGIRFFIITIDTMIDLVETFDLTWKDSIETISVLDLVCDIVKYELMDYQLEAKILQLLNMAISRCMSPSMTLLMDHTNDSVLSQMGSVLYSKCHNKNHQIRNNGLEVVRTLALNAKAKFPEFTNILFNAELPQLAVKMALNDKEDEVRATSLKCIHALICIEEIYDVYQSNNDFWDKILNILIFEPKGTVRKEAAKLVTAIYDQYSFPEEVLPRLYDVMTHAAVGDIHWEVKCNAFKFWTCTLKSHLREQGMTDRGFPTHTFSKEKKKIITLTEDEKRRREIKVLYQLSEIGCLYVFKTALQDKFDEEVSKNAMVLTKNMIKMLRSHKITCDNVLDQPPSPRSTFTKSSSLSPMSSDTHSSPERRFSLESTQSQYPDSLYSSDQSGYSPALVTHEDNDLFSFSSYNNHTLPNTQVVKDANTSSSYDTRNSQISNLPDKKLENIDFFNTEKDLSILENDVDMGVLLTENIMENAICDMAETEKMFDDLLKLNDATLLEEIYNPEYQTKATSTIKTKEYISPLEYVQFCNEVAESIEKKSTQLMQNKDEFDSLLDDFLNEYDPSDAT